MTGLNLESFLHLLRADFGAWLTLGIVALVLALMAWTSWGSRRALRKCLVLSVVAHISLALYGGTVPLTLVSDSLADRRDENPERIRRIDVSSDDSPPEPTSNGGTLAKLAPFDKLSAPLTEENLKREAPEAADRTELAALDRSAPPPLSKPRPPLRA